jgi:hypothetical protein
MVFDFIVNDNNAYRFPGKDQLANPIITSCQTIGLFFIIENGQSCKIQGNSEVIQGVDDGNN